MGGMSQRISTATSIPKPATTRSAERQTITVSSRETAGGSVALPKSPAKLYVPSGPRAFSP